MAVNQQGPLPYLDLINAGLGQILVGLPVAMAAYKLLYALFKREDPGLTFEQYNARLLAEGGEIKDFAVQWFEAHGFVKQDDGSWVKPAL